ncbi:MAG: hypothetical protein AB7F99_00715 [Vicinamibacterales bacterium]
MTATPDLLVGALASEPEPVRSPSQLRLAGTAVEVTAYRVGDDLVIVLNDARGSHIGRVVLSDLVAVAARGGRISHDILLRPEPTNPAPAR